MLLQPLVLLDFEQHLGYKGRERKGPVMTQEYSTQERLGTDGILHLDIPTGLSDVDVEVDVVIRPRTSPSSSLVGFAEKLRQKAGGCSFDMPEDFHTRRKDLYARSLAGDYQRKTQQ